MRRHDRAITSPDEIHALLDRCNTLHLGLLDENETYIVPLSYGWERIGESYVFYVHGAKEGRRHTLAEAHPRVCVEIDECPKFVLLDGGAQTADYKSFIGWGNIERIYGDEAVHALNLMCEQCGVGRMTCTEAVIANTCVEKIVVSEFTAKQRFKH